MLDHVGARYDLNAAHYVECTESTREGPRTAILDWIESHDEARGRFLWLAGMAGTGKTTIARTICKQLDNEDRRLGASFFFARDDVPGRRDPKKAVITLARQLADYPGIPFADELLAVLSKTGRTTIENLRLAEQFRLLICHPLNAALADLSQSEVVIVLDALDECEATSSNESLISVLSTVIPSTQLSKSIKFLITSCPEVGVREKLETAGERVETVFVGPDKEDPEILGHDIRLALRERLSPVFGGKRPAEDRRCSG